MNEPMILTVQEAHVPLEHWDELQRAARTLLQRLPPQMVQAYLLQSHVEPTLWQVVAVWHSQSAFEEYQRAVHDPLDVRILRAAGAEPQLALWHVVESMHAPTMVE